MNMWTRVSERDPRALAIVDGLGRFELAGPHYSRRTRCGAGGFVGVGQSIVFITRTIEDALWSVVHQKNPRGGPMLWRNNVFRNLGAMLSSALVRSATLGTFVEWVRRYGGIPLAPLRTEIDARFVRSSNPGFCYQMAGWVRFAGPPTAATRRPYMIYMTPGPALLRDALRAAAAVTNRESSDVTEGTP